MVKDLAFGVVSGEAFENAKGILAIFMVQFTTCLC